MRMKAEAKPKRIRLPLHGVLLLDKPAGLLNAEKAGHTGTLDPFATGLLPLCFGEATKFAQDLLEADKTYETVVHLGIATSTGDTEGEVLSTRPVDVIPEQIDAALAGFRGPIDQVPPMHSALKRDGRPLYEYARAGITLEREARRVAIHELTLLSWQAPFLRLSVTCSKGTYIRVLGEDIGAALGCGAHLNALRRTAVGSLSIAEAITLEQLEALPERAAALAPVDALLSSFPALALDEELSRRFLHGQRLALAGMDGLPRAGRVRVYRQEDRRLLGTAQLMEYGVLAPERLVRA
jgi:tRNA pseudouridine55 synthase